MYFSQQAVNRLAIKKGMRFPAKMPLPERLKKVQERMLDGDVTALNIFQKIGLYLGYTVPWYREFYGFDSMMILGRVTSGPGGVMKVALNSDHKAAALISPPCWSVCCCTTDENSTCIRRGIAMPYSVSSR